MSRRRQDIFSRSIREEVDLMLIPDDRLDSAEFIADIHAAHATLETALCQLTDKYSRVLRLLFGFQPSGECLSTSEAARLLKCDYSRIVCLRCNGISRLGARFGDLLRPFVDVRD